MINLETANNSENSTSKDLKLISFPPNNELSVNKSHFIAAAASSNGGMDIHQVEPDGDTRSEYSITDYERMKFVQEWINSISMFRFLRINNNNNNPNYRLSSSFSDNKGQSFKTIEF